MRVQLAALERRCDEAERTRDAALASVEELVAKSAAQPLSPTAQAGWQVSTRSVWQQAEALDVSGGQGEGDASQVAGMAMSQAPRLVMCSSRCSDASNFVLSQVVGGGSGAITITYHVKPSSRNAAAFAANIDKALRQAGSVLTHASTGTLSRGHVGLLATSLQQPVPS